MQSRERLIKVTQAKLILSLPSGGLIGYYYEGATTLKGIKHILGWDGRNFTEVSKSKACIQGPSRASSGFGNSACA